MNLVDLNINIIIDFDSTFVKLEGLEELARISLHENPRKDEIIKEIEKITNDGMTGKITFENSLEERLRLFKSNKNDISNLVDMLQENVTHSIVNNKSYFMENSQNIYVISGGFEDWICPIVLPYGVIRENVISNKFFYDEEGMITGIDKSIPLTKTGGKTQCVRNLTLSGKKIFIGDGFTDYEVKKNGEVDEFILFVENIHRKELDNYADHITQSWDEVLAYIS